MARNIKTGSIVYFKNFPENYFKVTSIFVSEMGAQAYGFYAHVDDGNVTSREEEVRQIDKTFWEEFDHAE